MPASAGAAESPQSAYQGLQHLPQARLDAILEQVRRHGFHVEHLADLVQGVEDDGTLEAIQRWCRFNDLKVNIQHALGICFFESRYSYPPLTR